MDTIINGRQENWEEKIRYVSYTNKEKQVLQVFKIRSCEMRQLLPFHEELGKDIDQIKCKREVLGDLVLTKFEKPKFIETSQFIASGISSDKNPIYSAKDGQDYLNRIFQKFPKEQVHGAMRFTLGKYVDRLGEKDSRIKEVKKIIDYANRYLEYLLLDVKTPKIVKKTEQNKSYENSES